MLRRGASLLLQRCGAPAAEAWRRASSGGGACVVAAAALPAAATALVAAPSPPPHHPHPRFFSASPSPKPSAAASAAAAAAAASPAAAAAVAGAANGKPGAAGGAVDPATAAAQAAVDEEAVRLEGRALFESCWRRFVEARASELRVPREVVWLNGAPGAGKSASIPHLLSTRGLTRHVSMSTLLEHDGEARRRMDHGELLSDALVVDRLLEAILVDQPGEADDAGFVVDGFPRTPLQCEFLKLLYEKLCDLHDAYGDSPRAVQFPRPSFKVGGVFCAAEACAAGSKKTESAARAPARAHKARSLTQAPPPPLPPPPPENNNNNHTNNNRSSSCGATRPRPSRARSCARASPASTTAASPTRAAGAPRSSSARRTRTSTRPGAATASSSSTTAP